MPQPIDGVDVSKFVPGCVYNTDPLVAALLICEGWAFPLPPLPSTPTRQVSILPPTPIYRK